MKKTLKIINAALICVFVLGALPCFALSAENVNYAEVVFENENICTNLSVTEDLDVVEVGGRYGKITSLENGNDYVHINVDNDFLYNLPEYTPIDITVEYYDDGYGSFALNYDSHNHDPRFGEDNNVWAAAEYVYLRNTKQWKSYTYHIEDMRFSDCCSYGSDFRIGVWDPYMNFSSEDVIFGSVRVEKSEFVTPIKFFGLTSANQGNVFSENEEIRFSQRIKNKTNQKVNAEYIYRIYDESGAAYCERRLSASLEGSEELVLELPITNPTKYGIYDIVVTENTTCAGETNTIKYNSEFSIAKDLSEWGRNLNFGICQQIAGGNQGAAEDAAELMSNAGIGILRDEIRWDTVELTKGVYEIPADKLERINIISESGAEIMLILCFWNPLYDEGLTPYTDEGINAFANYAAFMAKELKGKVKYFEVWNEYNAMPLFNNGYQPPETYAKMLKATYKAIKAVNDEAIVAGIATGDIDIEFASTVFENGGYDYLDAVSVHTYDWDGKFDETELHGNVSELKELMNRYGEEKPVYFTEIGYPTFDAENTQLGGWAALAHAYTQKEQAATQVFVNAYSQAYGLCDLLFQYCLYDKADQCDIESCFGIVNMWDDRENVPAGAKKSYISLAAFNYFAGSDSEFKKVTENERAYVFEYYNRRLGKGTALLVSGAGEQTINLELGCGSVELYDMYGNYLNSMDSADGSYSFLINETPYYALGDFNNAESNTIDIAVNGDVVTVSGKVNKVNSEITFIAVEEWSIDKVLAAADQKKTDKNGYFSFSFKAEKNEAYSIYIFDGLTKEFRSIDENGYGIKVAYYADDVLITDASQISKAGKIKAVLTVTNENDLKDELLFFGASYKEDTLLEAHCDKMVWEGNECIAEAEVSNTNDTQKIKFMLWNKNLEPLNVSRDIFTKEAEVE